MQYILICSISAYTWDSEPLYEYFHKHFAQGKSTYNSQIHDTEKSRSVHSSDSPEQSMLYIHMCSIPADIWDSEHLYEYFHKHLGPTKLYL